MTSAKTPRRPRFVPDSHYVAWDEIGGRVVKALCGTWIRRGAHSNDPTCDTCRQIKAEREKLEA